MTILCHNGYVRFRVLVIYFQCLLNCCFVHLSNIACITLTLKKLNVSNSSVKSSVVPVVCIVGSQTLQINSYSQCEGGAGYSSQGRHSLRRVANDDHTATGALWPAPGSIYPPSTTYIARSHSSAK